MIHVQVEKGGLSLRYADYWGGRTTKKSGNIQFENRNRERRFNFEAPIAILDELPFVLKIVYSDQGQLISWSSK